MRHASVFRKWLAADYDMPMEKAHDLELLNLDPWLVPYADKVRARHERYESARARFDYGGGLLGEISQGYKYFGLNRGELWGKPGVF